MYVATKLVVLLVLYAVVILFVYYWSTSNKIVPTYLEGNKCCLGLKLLLDLSTCTCHRKSSGILNRPFTEHNVILFGNFLPPPSI